MKKVEKKEYAIILDRTGSVRKYIKLTEEEKKFWDLLKREEFLYGYHLRAVDEFKGPLPTVYY